MNDLEQIRAVVDKCVRCVRTNLLIPDAAATLRLLSRRFNRAVKIEESASLVQELERLSEGGDVSATYELGLCYYADVCGAASFEDAAQKFHDAARHKHGDAISALGVCFMEGRGGEYSSSKALKLFQLGASLKNPTSVYNLGLCYFNGYGEIDQDFDLGIKYVREAAQLGSLDALNELGRICSQGGLDGEPENHAVKYFQEAATRGSGEGLFNLGIAYQTGDGVPENVTKAHDCFRQAYDAGYIGAYRVVAQLYRQGYFGAEDDAKATALVEEAAALHEPHAIWELANELFDQSSDPESLSRFFNLLSDGIRYGSADCALMLGDIVDKGMLGEEEKSQAVQFWALASYNGSGDGSAKLAQCFLSGRVVDQDNGMALAMLKRGVSQDSPIACYTLGMLLQTQCGKDSAAPVDAQYEMARKAASLFEMGAELGDAGCMRALANCYKKGLGVDKNETRAKELVKRAKELERENGSHEGFFTRIKRLFRRK